jgi:hypothetical protein
VPRSRRCRCRAIRILQRAVVSSTAMWFAGFAEGFIDNALRAQQTSDWIDANPLGTAAGYGVNLKLDREHTTQALGFARMQVSPIYAQLSRGKFEMAVLEAIASALLDLRRLAWDLSLFTTAEFNFVKLPSEYTTGSSIMPNKRNPDVVELLRASYASVAAARTEIEQLLSLPSGYQRDLQFSKGSLFHGCRHGLGALELVPDLLARMQWNEAAMRAAIEPAMYATDVAIEQAAAGVPFRDAYRRGGGNRRSAGQGRTPESSLAARVSPGAGHDLRLDELVNGSLWTIPIEVQWYGALLLAGVCGWLRPHMRFFPAGTGAALRELSLSHLRRPAQSERKVFSAGFRYRVRQLLLLWRAALSLPGNVVPASPAPVRRADHAGWCAIGMPPRLCRSLHGAAFCRD